MAQIATTTTQNPVTTAPTRSTPYYRLAYIAKTKKCIGLYYSSGITKSGASLFCADTYAEIQAFTTSEGFTGLPADPQIVKN